MHGDMKIGLALSVLLIGVVGAFFFRNESDSDDAGMHVVDYEALDRQIAEKDVIPYLTGVEVFDKAASRDSQASQDKSSTSGADPFDVALPDFLKESDAGQVATPHEPPPDPIPVERAADKAAKDTSSSPEKPAAGNAARASLTKPANRTGSGTKRPERTRAAQSNSNNAWEVVSEEPSHPEEEATFRMHRVTKGETLSGLAKTYLGSSSRFLEIYEANRDVLRNPNDLKVGMEIRIPQASAERLRMPRAEETVAPPFHPGGPSASRENADEQQSASSLFRPVRRTPLNPGRNTPSASNSQGGTDARK